MRHSSFAVILVVAMIALIVGVDVAFLRNHLMWRLIVNVGIVLTFGLIYIALRRRV